MKKKYSNDLPTLKELFPDWTDEDLVFALEDADGVLEDAIERITEGMITDPPSCISCLYIYYPLELALTLIVLSQQATSHSGVR
jgi:hypothetical protein